jgi:hypothetical protein
MPTPERQPLGHLWRKKAMFIPHTRKRSNGFYFQAEKRML